MDDSLQLRRPPGHGIFQSFILACSSTRINVPSEIVSLLERNQKNPAAMASMISVYPRALDRSIS